MKKVHFINGSLQGQVIEVESHYNYYNTAIGLKDYPCVNHVESTLIIKEDGTQAWHDNLEPCDFEVEEYHFNELYVGGQKVHVGFLSNTHMSAGYQTHLFLEQLVLNNPLPFNSPLFSNISNNSSIIEPSYRSITAETFTGYETRSVVGNQVAQNRENQRRIEETRRRLEESLLTPDELAGQIEAEHDHRIRLRATRVNASDHTTPLSVLIEDQRNDQRRRNVFVEMESHFAGNESNLTPEEEEFANALINIENSTNIEEEEHDN